MTKKQLEKVWSTLRVREIAAKFGVTDQTVYSRARAYGLPSRNSSKFSVDGPGDDDPTPQQIKERSELIKSSWTDEQRELRCVCSSRSGHYTIPCYESSEIFGKTESISYSRI